MSSANLMEVDSIKNITELVESNQNIDSNKVKWFDLNPDRKLLDANFEGYKLSLDSFAKFALNLRDQKHQLDTYTFIESTELKLKFLLYQHLKLFGFQNLLLCNHFNDSHLYYFDTDKRLIKIVYDLPKQLPTRTIVPTSFTLPAVTNLERTYPSGKFVTETQVVLFDGFDKLYFCQLEKSDNPLATEQWNVLFEWQTSAEETTCVLRDALLYEGNYHVLLVNVRESSNQTKSQFDTMLNWLTFETSGGWRLKQTRRLNCQSYIPDYISFETNGAALNIAAPNCVRFVYDSNGQINVTSEVKPQTIERKMDLTTNGEKFYSWNQTDNEVRVKVTVDLKESQLEKDLLKVDLKPDRVDITYDGRTIIEGEFYAHVNLDQSTWLVEQNMVELSLVKSKLDDAWAFLFKDTNEQVEKTNGKHELKTMFSLDQQLEECDGITDDVNMGNEENFLMLRRMDGHTHDETHKCFINDHKHLFNVRLSSSESSAFCLRHDVDGVVWQPHRVTADSTWLTHEHTFLAFGYVEASKQEAKFRLAPPDCSYVCIVDTKKHVYVYRQQSDKIQGELRNRKSGQTIKHIAKQYLISLDSDFEIYGAYASNDHLILLASDWCYIFKIKSSS